VSSYCSARGKEANALHFERNTVISLGNILEVREGQMKRKTMAQITVMCFFCWGLKKHVEH
jgi:hypothetical protein